VAAFVATMMVMAWGSRTAWAQVGADGVFEVPVHPNYPTVLHLPDEVTRARVTGTSIRVTGTGRTLHVRPRSGVRTGLKALLEVETMTEGQTGSGMIVITRRSGCYEGCSAVLVITMDVVTRPKDDPMSKTRVPVTPQQSQAPAGQAPLRPFASPGAAWRRDSLPAADTSRAREPRVTHRLAEVVQRQPSAKINVDNKSLPIRATPVGGKLVVGETRDYEIGPFFEEAGTKHEIQWWCYNDPVAVERHGAPVEVKGPSGYTWSGKWTTPGKHRLVCTMKSTRSSGETREQKGELLQLVLSGTEAVESILKEKNNAATGAVFIALSGWAPKGDVGGTTQGIIDQIKAEAEKAHMQGLHAEPFASDTDDDVKDDVISYVKKNHLPGSRIILYGYSWGGDTIMEVAKSLQKEGYTIDLLLTVDAAKGPASATVDREVPDNVKRNVNFYQTRASTIGSRGDSNRASNRHTTEVANVNLTKELGKQNNVTHGNIDEVTKEANLELVRHALGLPLTRKQLYAKDGAEDGSSGSLFDISSGSSFNR
jgi:hypothetical protein